MAGLGRDFFVRPDSLLASRLWDSYLGLSIFCASFLQFGTDREGLMHTWYDTVCTKEYWCKLLDEAGARRPLQLGAWDGAALRDVGPGIGFGRADLVCKISDSYLGIGDKVLARGVDFACRADVEAVLQADPQYAGKRAVLCELIRPAGDHLSISSDGYSQARERGSGPQRRRTRATERAAV